MAKKVDMVGQRIGRLKVISEAGRNKRKKVIWKCECDCGKIKTISRSSLQAGRTLSCGCQGRENRLRACTKHGWYGSPEHKSWRAMRDRCRNLKHSAYKNYGGRGITICKRWDDFRNFLKDMGVKPSNKHTIERRDNNGNYEPSNCMWDTVANQNKNKRRAANVVCPNCQHIFDVMEKR